MMTMNMSGHNPGVGPSLGSEEFIIWNRSAATVTLGQVLMLDHLAADGTSLSTADLNAEGTVAGQLTHPWGNGLDPTTAGIGTLSGTGGVGTGSAGAPLVVVTSLLADGGVDNSKVKVCVYGLCNISCITTEPVVFGDTLYAAAANTLTPLVTAGIRPVAKSLGAKADNATNLVPCFFNGWDMFSPQCAS
jgi:hypothetical protein